MKNMFFTFIVAISLFPVPAFAHGTGEQYQREMMMNSYVLIGSAILFALFLILHFSAKNKVNSPVVKVYKWGWVLTLVGVLVTGGMYLWGNRSSGAADVTTLHHIHGLGYSSDGQRILIPAHDGLRVYSQGQWSIPETAKHDYMGFSMIDDGFYSSGHPAPGTKLKEPLGIVKSKDEGKTIETLDLAGETDFHGMTASYKSHTIYAFTPAPNSKMKSKGLYYTKDETKTWTKSEMKGINEDLSALAVHPTKDSVVALGTDSGVYLSKDYGQNFEKILPDIQVTSLSFDNEGALYVGGLAEKPLLLRFDLETKKTGEIEIPTLKDDAVTYFTQNPVNKNELVFATYNKDIYLSGDKGVSWTKIADKGKGISQSKH
ncbi:F510_1955 family glycosylhydrolase [Effusibacillus consociatus]|uniref:F510_1955 family glycosylhydrolase n=1 Tax=Effusibacillus consociatus TaxID=1117041 RepID=A0ABV9Q2W0_9BACL